MKNDVHKRYILRFNQKNSDSVYSFQMLRASRKKIETRAATKRYKTIAVGDTLLFVCGNRKLERIVKNATVFKTIKSMLQTYRVKDIMPDRSTQKELEETYYGYAGYREKLKKNGIIALELE